MKRVRCRSLTRLDNYVLEIFQISYFDCHGLALIPTRKMKVFYHLDCLLHNPPTEFLDGKPVPYLESPSRITIIKSTLQEEPSYFDITDKLDDDLDLKQWILTVHENAYLDYLEKGYDDWIADGGDEVLTIINS